MQRVETKVVEIFHGFPRTKKYKIMVGILIYIYNIFFSFAEKCQAAAVRLCLISRLATMPICGTTPFLSETTSGPIKPAGPNST